MFCRVYAAMITQLEIMSRISTRILHPLAGSAHSAGPKKIKQTRFLIPQVPTKKKTRFLDFSLGISHLPSPRYQLPVKINKKTFSEGIMNSAPIASLPDASTSP